jgi:hypothetical protein
MTCLLAAMVKVGPRCHYRRAEPSMASLPVVPSCGAFLWCLPVVPSCGLLYLPAWCSGAAVRGCLHRPREHPFLAEEASNGQ